MKSSLKILAFMLASCLLSACETTTLDNTTNANNRPYDRNKLCESLNRQLTFYENPNYYSAHPVPEAKLDSIYEQYKANGCDK